MFALLNFYVYYCFKITNRNILTKLSSKAMNIPNKTLYKDVTGQYPAYIKPMIEIIEISVEKGFADTLERPQPEEL